MLQKLKNFLCWWRIRKTIHAIAVTIFVALASVLCIAAFLALSPVLAVVGMTIAVLAILCFLLGVLWAIVLVLRAAFVAGMEE